MEDRDDKEDEEVVKSAAVFCFLLIVSQITTSSMTLYLIYAPGHWEQLFFFKWAGASLDQPVRVSCTLFHGIAW